MGKESDVELFYPGYEALPRIETRAPPPMTGALELGELSSSLKAIGENMAMGNFKGRLAEMEALITRLEKDKDACLTAGLSDSPVCTQTQILASYLTQCLRIMRLGVGME